MHCNPLKTRPLARRALSISLAVGASLFSSLALADCGSYGHSGAIPANWDAAHPGSSISTQDIVGLWKFSYTSDGSAYPAVVPNGAPVDFGTVQWHSDGTEFTISGGRAPSTGDVCMGVWEKTGASSYKLKHIALAWASGDTPANMGGPVTPAVFVGPAIIRQNVTLDKSGNSYAGTFSIDQYATDGVTLLQHVAGKVTATRFTVD